MPKTQLDWLGIVSLWIGAVVLAFKASDAPLVNGAPLWLAAHWWNYVPLALMSLYLVIAIYRLLQRPDQNQPQTSGGSPPLAHTPPEPVVDIQPKPATAPPDHRNQRREDERVNDILRYAKDDAAIAASRYTSSNRNRTAESAIPRMKAALLSAHKHYGTPPLFETGEAHLDLELGRRLIEKVLPLLQEGHVDEARQEADAFMSRMTRRAAGDQASS